MQPLFKSTEKTAEFGGFNVETDPTTWARTITVNFLRQFPFLQNEMLQITWNKTEFDRGFAVGSLNILGGSVPVIVREWRVSPLDVYISPELTMPLTQDLLASIMDDRSGFAGLRNSQQKATTALFTGQDSLQFAPNEYAGNHQSKIVSRPAVKVASALATITDISPEQVEKVLEWVKEAELDKTLEEKGWSDLLGQLKTATTKRAALQEYINQLDIDRQLVYQDEAGNYRVKQANSQFNYTWDTRITKDEARELEKLIVNDKTVDKIAQTYTRHEQPAQVKPGEEGFFTQAGVNTPYIMISEVIPMRVEKTASFQLTSGELLQVAEDRWNIVATGTENFIKLASQKPQVGQTGFFMNKLGSTEPGEIVDMHFDVSRPGNWEITVDHGLKLAKYLPLNVGEQVTAHETQANTYYIPKTAAWVELPKKQEKIAQHIPTNSEFTIIGQYGQEKIAFFISSEATEIKKLADNQYILPATANFIDDSQVTFKTANLDQLESQNNWIYRDDAGFYQLKGAAFKPFEKTADLTQHQAVWQAIHAGAVVEDLEKLAQLEKGDMYKFTGRLQAPQPVSYLDSAAEKIAHAPDIAEINLQPLIKVAKNFRDRSSVDAILALGVLRKRNVEQYLLLIPTYEVVLAELAKLIVASRLGLANIDPEPIKEAMESLAEVVLMLKTLESMVKPLD